MAQDILLSASLYFHNCRVVLIQSAAEDKKHGENVRMVWKAWPHTLWRGKIPRGQSTVVPQRGSARRSPRPLSDLTRQRIEQRAISTSSPALTRLLKKGCRGSIQCRVVHVSAGFNSSATLIKSSGLWLKVYLETKTHHGSQWPVEEDAVFWLFIVDGYSK